MGFQGLRDNCSTRHLLLTSVTALCEVTFRHFPPKSSIHSGSRQQANTELPSKRNAEETKVPTVDLFLRLTGGRQPTALNSGKEGGTKTSPSSGRSENVNTLSPIGTVPVARGSICGVSVRSRGQQETVACAQQVRRRTPRASLHYYPEPSRALHSRYRRKSRKSGALPALPPARAALGLQAGSAKAAGAGPGCVAPRVGQSH